MFSPSSLPLLAFCIISYKLVTRASGWLRTGGKVFLYLIHLIHTCFSSGSYSGNVSLPSYKFVSRGTVLRRTRTDVSHHFLKHFYLLYRWYSIRCSFFASSRTNYLYVLPSVLHTMFGCSIILYKYVQCAILCAVVRTLWQPSKFAYLRCHISEWNCNLLDISGLVGEPSYLEC